MPSADTFSAAMAHRQDEAMKADRLTASERKRLQLWQTLNVAVKQQGTDNEAYFRAVCNTVYD